MQIQQKISILIMAILQYKHLINIRYCSIEHFCHFAAAFTCNHSSHRRNCLNRSIVKLSQQINRRYCLSGSIVELSHCTPETILPWWIFYNYHIYGQYHEVRHTDILRGPCWSWVRRIVQIFIGIGIGLFLLK